MHILVYTTILISEDSMYHIYFHYVYQMKASMLPDNDFTMDFKVFPMAFHFI